MDSVKDYFYEIPGWCVVGKCKIVVKQGSPVVNIPLRQIPVHIAPAMEKEIEKMLNSDIIVPSEAEWSSLVVPVKKKDSSIRLCINYRELNDVTPLRYR